jgi:nitrate reductase NapAB chaperone NapD
VNLSGILVTADPAHLGTVVAALADLPGLEVRAHQAEQGRIVVVQEAPDVGAEVDGFLRIRALPHVLSADLVCHYFDDEPSIADPAVPGVAA